jgi:ribosome maturation factor RimP
MAHRDHAAGRGPGVGRRGATRPARTAAAPTAGDLAAHRARLTEVIGPVVEAAGCDLEELNVSRAGRRHLLRITVDADGGVSLDAVADLSRDISAALDTAEETGGDFGTGEYVLEVSSPGVDRPLRQPRHWRRNVGRLVEVPVGDGKVTGRVVEADDHGVTLEVDGRRHGYGYPHLGPGRVQLEFGRLAELDELDEGDEPGGHDDAEEDGE